MKLIIQIPCFNEAQSLPTTLAALPRVVEGFDEVEWLVIDDGSTDATRQVARDAGVDHVVGFRTNRGLARAFMLGLDAAVRAGADVIVNTDADNQYDAACIPELVRPILAGTADLVIGARPISDIQHFSFLKKCLQRLGSAVVRLVSGTEVPDAPSGFRAISREAALQLNVFSEYTYTLETILQAGMKNMAIESVPVRVNAEQRPSRLVRSISNYVRRSLGTLLRIGVVYSPFRFFMTIGVGLFLLGFLLGVRFLVYYIQGDGDGHIQSVILAGILLVIGFQTALIAFIADLLAVNRKLLEDIRYQQRRQESASSGTSSKRSASSAPEQGADQVEQ